jgi:ribosomal-protein-alanine N-acetyltransferase
MGLFSLPLRHSGHAAAARAANPLGESMNTLYTDRLILRPFTAADLEAIYAILNRPDVWLYDPGKPRTLDETRDLLARWIADYDLHGFGRFAVVLRDTGTIIGYCGLQWLLLDHGVYKSPEVELFYALAPEYWGQGYITEAAQAVIRFAFTDIKLRRIVSTALSANTRSLSVMRRLEMHVIRDPFDPDWIVGIIDNPVVEVPTPKLVSVHSH